MTAGKEDKGAEEKSVDKVGAENAKKEKDMPTSKDCDEKATEEKATDKDGKAAKETSDTPPRVEVPAVKKENTEWPLSKVPAEASVPHGFGSSPMNAVASQSNDSVESLQNNVASAPTKDTAESFLNSVYPVSDAPSQSTKAQKETTVDTCAPPIEKLPSHEIAPNNLDEKLANKHTLIWKKNVLFPSTHRHVPRMERMILKLNCFASLQGAKVFLYQKGMFRRIAMM